MSIFFLILGQFEILIYHFKTVLPYYRIKIRKILWLNLSILGYYYKPIMAKKINFYSFKNKIIK